MFDREKELLYLLCVLMIVTASMATLYVEGYVNKALLWLRIGQIWVVYIGKVSWFQLRTWARIRWLRWSRPLTTVARTIQDVANWLDAISNPPLRPLPPDPAEQSKPETERPVVTVDIVLTRRSNDRLYMLLVQRQKAPFKHCWALPGGKLSTQDDTLYGAAQRELLEETGIRVPLLYQGRTYGDKWRDERGRYISVVYYAPTFDHVVEPRAGDDAIDARWFPLELLPQLAFDHQLIIHQTLPLIEATRSEVPLAIEIPIRRARDTRPL